MSEYQYYEFLAIDRPLSESDMRWVRGLSTRAQITPTSFVNTYHWGDFKGDPQRMMERCFDAFVYVSNFGYSRFMLKLPLDAIDIGCAKLYCRGLGARLKKLKTCVLVELALEGEPGDWEFDDDGFGRMSSLAPLRDDLLSGDYRALYLAWLLNIQYEEHDDEVEPPVPAGLRKLTAPLKALADFLHIEESLIKVAAAGSEPLEHQGLSRKELKNWVRGLPVHEKDAALTRLLDEGAGIVRRELMNRFRRSEMVRCTGKSSAARTAAQIHKEWVQSSR